MRRSHHRSLLTFFALRIVAPLSGAMIALTVASFLIHQQVVSALLLDRDGEMATLAADNVQHEVREYTEALKAVARDRGLLDPSLDVRRSTLHQAASNLQHRFAGFELLDARGQVIGVGVPASMTHLAEMAVIQGHVPSFDNPHPSLSDVVLDPNTGANYVFVGVPLFDGAGSYAGVLLGGAAMQNTEMTELLAALTIGERGFAYLVDRKGHVVFHHDARQTGQDLSDLPFVQRVLAGETSGLFWTSPQGEHLIVDYAPVKDTGWGVITQEPWDVAVAPVRQQGALLLMLGIAVILATLALLWQGVRRVASPIAWLVGQTARLAVGSNVEPAKASSISEIDALGTAFDRMATQIVAYREGLRRYAGAITYSQEEERRRIARELHDATVQDLHGIARRLEVCHAAAVDPRYRAELAEIRRLVTEAMYDVRQIIHDLRPRMLEDLGLIPSLESLVQTASEDAPIRVSLDVTGEPRALSAEQDLVIYRVTQEALANVHKHATAKAVQIQLMFEPQAVRLAICDDGQGFWVPNSLTEFIHRGNLGLMGIQERVWSAGGSFSIESAPGRGARLYVTLPTPTATPNATPAATSGATSAVTPALKVENAA